MPHHVLCFARREARIRKRGQRLKLRLFPGHPGELEQHRAEADHHERSDDHQEQERN